MRSTATALDYAQESETLLQKLWKSTVNEDLLDKELKGWCVADLQEDKN